MKKKKNRFRSVATAGLLIAALVAAFLFFRHRQAVPEPGPAAGNLVVRFLDIGQGDSELITLPNSETILIDSGDRGAPTVDPHSDHIGEMRDVMRAFKVREFWDSGFNHPTKTYGDMLQEIKDRGVNFATPKRGDLRKFGDVMLEVLNPGEAPPDDNPNNASIVVRLSFGEKKFLFTGDAEEYDSRAKPSAWQEMIEGQREKLKADLLKAAHHGSSNGTTRDVLDVVRPSIVTISCAAGNDYHHPHPKVMQMLERVRTDIELYRTDLQGTITAVCDGHQIKMSTDKPVTINRVYLTGDDVAGTVASDGGKSHASRRSR
jgi:competence protein ComEC